MKRYGELFKRKFAKDLVFQLNSKEISKIFLKVKKTRREDELMKSLQALTKGKRCEFEDN